MAKEIRKQALSMVHWNGNQVVAMDCETTGLDSEIHEIWNFAAVASDSNFKVRQDIIPLEILIRPSNMELIDWNTPVHKGNKARIMEAHETGFTPEAARDLFLTWYEKLGLPLNRSGYNRCKVYPLGHNFAFDKSFLTRWLDIDTYNELFHYHYMDTMHAAMYLNDRAGMHAQNVPYPQVSLVKLCNSLNIENTRAHTALSDALATLEVYRRLTLNG